MTLTPALILIGGVAAWQSVRRCWWRPATDWRRPRVLMYHMVRDHQRGARFNKLRVQPAEFEKQVAWLKSNGFTFLFVSELVDGGSVPERAVCLTFDDGYEDNLLAADPTLERYGAKATLYLVGERGGGWSSKKKTHHADDELASEPKLSDDQVQAMVSSGRWELGGHTRSHANLPALDDDTARQEIGFARRDFPARFGCEAVSFAYPFGLFDERHVTMAGQEGYACAVTTEPGIPSAAADDPLRLPRIKVSGKEGMFDFRLRLRTGRRGLRK